MFVFCNRASTFLGYFFEAECLADLLASLFVLHIFHALPMDLQNAFFFCFFNFSNQKLFSVFLKFRFNNTKILSSSIIRKYFPVQSDVDLLDQ